MPRASRRAATLSTALAGAAARREPACDSVRGAALEDPRPQAAGGRACVQRTSPPCPLCSQRGQEESHPRLSDAGLGGRGPTAHMHPTRGGGLGLQTSEQRLHGAPSQEWGEGLGRHVGGGGGARL